MFGWRRNYPTLAEQVWAKSASHALWKSQCFALDYTDSVDLTEAKARRPFPTPV